MPTVVLGVTGCIGAYKACEVLRELQRRDVHVHVVKSEHATRFVGAMPFDALCRHPPLIQQFILRAHGVIRHIRLAAAADLLLRAGVPAGPPVEDIDPARFISTRSSGRMGYRLAEVARDRGAKVVLVAGPTALAAPRGVEVVAVRSGGEMAKGVLDKAAAAGIVAM